MRPGARWQDAEIPWFVTVLGAPSGSNAVSRLRSQYALVDKSPYPGGPPHSLENDELGIAVVLIKDRVDCVMFGAQPARGFGGPNTPCFLGARYGMSRERVHRLYGPPDAEIEPRPNIFLAHAGIDRYHRRGFTVAFVYDAVTGGLEILIFETTET